ncbi:MAG: hypothetical protein ABW252_22815 [Polyangiales bacterium]
MNSRFSSAPTKEQDLARWALGTLLGLYVVLSFTHAWVVDDAYITLRTVDNFVNGLGLRWNPSERVQSYTHPLWMFLLSAVYFVTREAFYTTIVVSFVISTLAISRVLRAPWLRAAPHRAPMFVAMLLGSKAFLDYSSSGLENPLTHLLMAVFYVRFLGDEEAAATPTEARQRALFYSGVAALAFVNRIDSLLLFAPACVLVLRREWSHRGAFARGAMLGATPALAWVAFSFLYYGAVVPNTALAKLAGPRVELDERLSAGVAYFADAFMNDPLSLLFCGLALAITWSTRRPVSIAAAGGVLLYLVYVLTTGAVGTHMSGRFFSGPLFLSTMLLAAHANYVAQALGTVAVVALWLLASPVSPLRVGFDTYAKPELKRGDGHIIDTRQFVLQEGAALLNVSAGASMPTHEWYRAGRAYRNEPERVHLGGLVVSLAIGYSGFAAGPEKHFIDILGLSDPLIARIPLSRAGGFRPGHFFREIPAGYVQSVEQGANVVEDPDLHEYYEAIRVITREPVFSGARLSTLFAFATGAYDARLAAYAERNGLRAP